MPLDWLRRVRQGILSVTRSSSLSRPRPRRGEFPSAVPALVQRLEPRQLLSVNAVGPEFQVNIFTTGGQTGSTVAMDADGGFVVTWTSTGQDGSGNGVYAQRYNAAGVAQGSEFRVNTFTTDNQWISSVAMDADGDFVVTWQSLGQDGNGNGVYAQRFNAAGVAQGSEFQVNTFTTSHQSATKVAMDGDGDFVVTWSSGILFGVGQDGSGVGVYAQRYNSAGVAQGSEFQVNTFTTNDQLWSTVAMDADGDFVVTWSSYDQDGSDFGIYAQRYNAAGIAQGSEFQVNTFTTGSQAAPTVAMDGDGDFVVTWSSPGQDGSDYGIYAQRYNAAGIAQGSEFQVNTFTTGSQYAPTVAMDADGDFVVTWTSSGQDGYFNGIYAQRYNEAGVAQGSEFRVNTFTTSDQQRSAVAMDADGDFVVTWWSRYQDGFGDGIYAQRYNAAGVAQGSEFQVNTFTTNFQRFSTVAMDADGNFVVAWSSDQDGSGYGIYAQRYNAAGVAQGGEFRVNTFTFYSQFLSTVAMDADGDFVVTWESNNQDGSGYGVYAQRYGGGSTPTAFPIAPVINEDTPIMGGLLWAFDPEKPIDSLIYTITTPPTHGTVTQTGVRSFNYTPQTNFTGVESFLFTASDGVNTSAPATVSITINPVPGIPSFDSAPRAVDSRSLADGLTIALTSLTMSGAIAPTGVSRFDVIPDDDVSAIEAIQNPPPDQPATTAAGTFAAGPLPTIARHARKSTVGA